MTCNDTREYLFAFLDSELDAPLSIEVQRHLDGCPACAREAEIERTIRKRLASALDVSTDTLPDVDGSVSAIFSESQDAPGSHRAPISARAEARGSHVDATKSESLGTIGDPRGLMPAARWIAAMAAAVLILVTASAWLMIGVNKKADSTSRFAGLVVADFEHFLDEGSTLHVSSSDRREVAAWLFERTGVAITLSTPTEVEYTLVGGRKCKIDGKPAAFAVYDIDGASASLVAVAAEHVQLDDMQRIQQADSVHWVARCKGYTVVARKHDGLVYAAVSKLSEDTLLRLIPGIFDESH